jgi:hypothetical protein
MFVEACNGRLAKHETSRFSNRIRSGNPRPEWFREMRVANDATKIKTRAEYRSTCRQPDPGAIVEIVVLVAAFLMALLPGLGTSAATTLLPAGCVVYFWGVAKSRDLGFLK